VLEARKSWHFMNSRAIWSTVCRIFSVRSALGGSGFMVAGVSMMVWLATFSQSGVARASESARLDG